MLDKGYMFWWSNKMKWFNFARMHKNRLKIKYLYGSAFTVPKIQNDATAIMDFMDCIVYNNINRTRHASQRCWACRVIYKNVTDVVTDFGTNNGTDKTCHKQWKSPASIMNVKATSEQAIYRLLWFFFAKNQSSLMPLLLLIRKRSRSHRLFVCKRTRNAFGSLPTFCESVFGT